MQGNSKRFINAYNLIDKTLRNILGLKPSLTFTDVVRKAATTSTLIRKYEDDLLDYGRLRNAIVHKSTDTVIAEPHLAVVEHIEHIAKLISTPPTAERTVAKRAVVFQNDLKLNEAIRLMASANLSNVPVLKGGVIVGVISNKLIVEAIAQHLEGVQEFTNVTTIEQVLGSYREHYQVAKSDITIDEVLKYFYANRKLQIIILTRGGSLSGEIVGVVTGGDILEINRIMENY